MKWSVNYADKLTSEVKDLRKQINGYKSNATNKCI